MIRPQHRHSQTLNIKNPLKQIQVTLINKLPSNNNFLRSEMNSENNMKYKPVQQIGLSMSIPLRQRSVNNLQTNLVQHKSLLRSLQQKPKKQTRWEEKIDWSIASTHNYCNPSRNQYQSSVISQMQKQNALVFPSSLQLNNQFGKLIQSNGYLRFPKQIQHTESRFQSFNVNQDPCFDKVPPNLPQSQRQQAKKNSSSSINSVKSKIKGISKGFLRESKNKQNINEKSLAINAIHSHRQSILIEQQPINCKTLRPNRKKSLIRFELSDDKNVSSLEKSVKQDELKPEMDFINYLSNNESLIHQNLTSIQQSKLACIQQKLSETSNLKKQYAQLSQRLQKCVEQIDFLQISNSTERIVELESEISQMKQSHQEEKISLLSKIQHLQQIILQKQSIQQNTKVPQNIETQTIQVPSLEQALQLAQKQIAYLQLKLQELSQSYSNKSSLTSSLTNSRHSTWENADIGNSVHEIQILRRKYQTLEQLLDSKKKEIQNKDSIIQVLMGNQVQKVVKENKISLTGKQKEQKLKLLVSDLFNQLQERIMNL